MRFVVSPEAMASVWNYSASTIEVALVVSVSFNKASPCSGKEGRGSVCMSVVICNAIRRRLVVSDAE